MKGSFFLTFEFQKANLPVHRTRWPASASRVLASVFHLFPLLASLLGNSVQTRASGPTAWFLPASSLAKQLLSDSRAHWPCLGYVLSTEIVLVVKDHSAWPEPDDTPPPEVVKKERWGTGEVGRKLIWTLWTKTRRGIIPRGKSCCHYQNVGKQDELTKAIEEFHYRARQSEQGLVIS